MLPSLELYNDEVPRSAPLNMALDEVFWRSAPTARLRFYRWDHPAISFGYFGRYEDVAPFSDKWEIVRRCTGGGIVFHGDDLTYALIIPAAAVRPAPSTPSVYAFVHQAVQTALLKCGIGAEMMAGRNAGTFTPQDGSDSEARAAAILMAVPPNACFGNPVAADVMVSGQKVAGAAQRRSRAGLLQQGSIQNVQLPCDFRRKFAEQLAKNLINREIDSATIEHATELAESKYATKAWLHRQ